MLINGSDRVGAKTEPRDDRDRATTSRLIALAIGRRSTDEPEGWSDVAERIAALAPDFALLHRFIRREPALLSAYFVDSARARALIERCRPNERLLVRHACDLAAGRPLPITVLTGDERQRVRLYELSLLAGAPEPASIAAAAEDLGLRTPEGISALAFLLLRTRPTPAHVPPLHIISAWPEDRKRVFFWRYMAVNFQRRLSPFAAPAKTFRLSLTPEETARVARLQMPGQLIIAKRNGITLLAQMIQRAGLPACRWFDISLTLPRLAAMVTVEFWTRLVRNTLGAVKAEDYLGRAVTIRMMTRRFGADGVLHLYKHYGVRSLSEHNLENGARSSKKILKDFAGRFPQILPPQVLESVESFTSDRDTYITLVNEYMLGRTPEPNGDVVELVAAAFETPAAVMRDVLQSETGRRLLAALSHFRNRHSVNLLRSIAFRGDERASPEGLDGYLYELRNAFSLELAMMAARRGGRPIGRNAQRRLFDKFFLLEFETDRLPPEQIDAARRRLRSRAVSRINALLDAQGATLRLDSQDLDALSRDWRDAEPVVTLLARLSDPARRGGPSTAAAQLVLHAAKAAAQRNFMTFKFDDAGAQRQLSFLSHAQRAAWRAARALVRIGGGARPDNQARLEQLTRGLDADLKRLYAGAPPEPAPLTPELRAEISELAGEEIKADPAVVAERTLAAHAPRESIPACARACLMDIAAQLNDAMLGGFEQRNAARLMRALVRIGFAHDIERSACQAVLADLRTIEREIPRDLLDGETISKGIVVTAFDCSPRLMLTIGDVVNTGSCLNYQSGSRINVLPAYLVDANIQALVSWQLKQSHFASVRDYKAVLNAFVGGRAADTAFDGDQLVFRFTLPEGDRLKTIETVSLGFAHLRQIVRLGRARKRLLLHPALLAEREYAQPHPLQPLMHANHSEILRRLSDEMGAVDSRPIKFPQSRNPDGVYCDARGGVQTAEYIVYQQ
jgi:hypothetical protein